MALLSREYGAKKQQEKEMTAPQHLIRDYRMPPKSTRYFKRNEAEDIFDYVIRDRLALVESTPLDNLDATHTRLLLEAESELERLQSRSGGEFSPAEMATYKSLEHRIMLQKMRCCLEAQPTA